MTDCSNFTGEDVCNAFLRENNTNPTNAFKIHNHIYQKTEFIY